MRNAVNMLSGIAIGVALTLVVAAGPLSAEGEEVASITKAQWAAEMAKNTSAAMKNIADDCTIFIPDFPSRLEGKAQIRTLFETGAEGAGDIVMAEMANPHVQVYGDVAVFSYNYMGMNRDKEGVLEPSAAKSSRVYVKQRGGWMLVHANFAPAAAPGN